MIKSLFFYLSVATITAGFFSIGRTSKSKSIGAFFVFLSICIPTIIAAFRYYVGTDYQTYVSIFNIISDATASEANNMYDVLGAGGVGVWLIAKVSKIGGLHTFFGLFQFLTLFFYTKALEQYKCKHYFTVMFVYMLSAFPVSLNIVKQALAMAISFYALKYAREKRLVCFLIWIGIAMTIHSTSAIILPVFLIGSKQTGKANNIHYLETNRTIKCIGLFLIALTASLSFKEIITIMGTIGFGGGLASTYLDNLYGGRNLSFFIQLTLLIIIVFLSRRLIHEDSNMYMLIALIAIGTGLEAIGFISVVIKRLAMFYYLLPATVVVAMFPECCVEENNSRTIVISVIWITYTLLFFVIYCLMGQGGITPYRFML